MGCPFLTPLRMGGKIIRRNGLIVVARPSPPIEKAAALSMAGATCAMSPGRRTPSPRFAVGPDPYAETDELGLWEVQAELRGAQLMLEAAQRNRQEAQRMLLQDGTLATGSWADSFVRSQAKQEQALRQQQQTLQAEIWQADLELQVRPGCMLEPAASAPSRAPRASSAVGLVALASDVVLTPGATGPAPRGRLTPPSHS